MFYWTLLFVLLLTSEATWVETTVTGEAQTVALSADAAGSGGTLNTADAGTLSFSALSKHIPASAAIAISGISSGQCTIEPMSVTAPSFETAVGATDSHDYDYSHKISPNQ